MLLALLVAGAGAAETKDGNTKEAGKRKNKDKLLDAKLAVVERAQKNRTDTKAVNVTSDLIEEVPEAELWNADADISTVGSCEQGIEQFCRKVEPGEGRLAECLTEQLEEEEDGDSKGHVVSDDCWEELSAFKMDRATNVNKDVPLAKACRADIKKHCSKKKYDRSNAADVLDCLRRVRKKKLSDKCAERVHEEQEEEAKDWRVDSMLYAACYADVGALCEGVDPREEGAFTQCLVDKYSLISAGACKDQLKRVEVERAEDVRLDRPLLRACSADIRRFCADEEYGEGKMQECLEDHHGEEEFSERCRAALEGRLQRASSDYELNYGLRESCEGDVAELCGKEREALALLSGFAADAQVITCLETKRAKIRDERCREEVHRQLAREAEDLRFDHELAQACHGDVRKHCNATIPGSARVITCLEEQRGQLSKPCSAQLFRHEEMLAEDIDFKYPLQRACVTEISIFCADTPHGHARVVRCLQDKVEDGEMSDECRAEVKKDELKASHDYRLNYRLQKACSGEVSRLCKKEAASCAEAGQECEGRVTDCLRAKLDDIRGEECRKEVFHVVKAQAFDYRLDAQMGAACSGDIASHCKGVQAGKGRMHACLREHWKQLSQSCKDHEHRLSILQARDVRLRPHLRDACSGELASFCKDVEPGKARAFRCLVDHMGKPGFSEGCRGEVAQHTAAAQGDYRLDFGVSSACQADVGAQCQAAQRELQKGGQEGVVLRCLVGTYKTLSEGCQSELSRSARMALWAYKEGAPLTGVCDPDVKARCPALPRSGKGFFKTGAVGKCLAQQAAQGGAEAEALSFGCRKLVLVAAPRDARAVFDSSMSLEAVANKVAQIAHSAGVSKTFVDPKAHGMAAITLTGWVAFSSVCALAVVLLGTLSFAAWRYVGRSRVQHSYAPVAPMKEGDV